MRYTGEEYLGLIKDINRRSFIRTIPFSGGLACVLGVIGWLIGGPLDGLMMFILSVAVSVGIMLMNRRRAKHMIGRIEPADMQVQFRLSEKAVSMRVNSGQEARLEWGQIAMRWNGRTVWNFYGSGNAFWRIPKTLHPGHGWAAAAGQPPCRSQNRRKRLKGVPAGKGGIPDGGIQTGAAGVVAGR